MGFTGSIIKRVMTRFLPSSDGATTGKWLLHYAGELPLHKTRIGAPLSVGKRTYQVLGKWRMDPHCTMTSRWHTLTEQNMLSCSIMLAEMTLATGICLTHTSTAY